MLQTDSQSSAFALSTMHVHTVDTVRGKEATTNIHGYEVASSSLSDQSQSLTDFHSLTPVSFVLVFLTKFMCALISRFGPFFAPYLALYFGATTEQVLDICQIDFCHACLNTSLLFSKPSSWPP